MRAISSTATSKKKTTNPTGLNLQLASAIDQAYAVELQAQTNEGVCLPDRQAQHLLIIQQP